MGAAAANGAGVAAPPTAGDDGMPMAGNGAAAGSDAAGTVAEPIVGDPDLGSVGLGSGGVGVSDLDAATDFFVKLVGMTMQSEIRREDRTERIFTIGPAGKPTLTLMHFDDGRNTKDIPAKLVFYSQNPSEAIAKISAGGYAVILSGAIGVGQVYGFDGYVLEIISDPTGPMFISIAFAVTDLTKTVSFYTDVFGCKSTGSYYAGTLQEEFIQANEGGAALVVQHYTAGAPNYRDNPVKSVWHVTDATATLAKIVSLGGTMVSAPAPLPAYNNKIVAVAKDFDGYVIELVQ